LIGFVWILVSVIVGFKVASSGAILVAGCIIGKLLFDRLLWRRAGRDFRNNLVLRETDENGDSYYIQEDRKFLISGTRLTKSFDLLRRADSLPHRSMSKKIGGTWNLSSSLDNFDGKIVWIISISTVIGTLIWAYANN